MNSPTSNPKLLMTSDVAQCAQCHTAFNSSVGRPGALEGWRAGLSSLVVPQPPPMCAVATMFWWQEFPLACSHSGPSF